MTNIIFTNPEYRELAFRRKGSRSLHPSDQQVRKTVIKEYQNLSFDPYVIAAPSYRQTNNLVTIHEVARRVIENDFINFGDPDHLALIRLDGLVLMKLVAILASARYRIEFRLPNFIRTYRKLAWVQPTLQEQLDFLNQRLPLVNLTRPPLRTYEEIVALTETPYPTGT